MNKLQTAQGFSVLEVLLAATIFLLFTASIVTSFLQGLQANRLGEEQTIANAFATEGLEAIHSIKNQSFATLFSCISCRTGTGVLKAGGVWTLTGTNNTLTHNASDNYTRIITISDVQRDQTGNIVQSGGSTDPNSLKITSTVSWLVSPLRNNSVSLTTYLTDFRKPLPQGGFLVYGDGSTTTDAIKYKILDPATGVWSTPQPTADIDPQSSNRALRAVLVFASATRNEKIVVSRHFDGKNQYIYVQVFNGATWTTPILLSSWNSTSFLDVRNFDGTYLNDGTFMAVYSDNTNTPKSRIWNGSSWSTQTNTVNIGDIPSYIVVRARPGTNEVMLADFDQAKDTNTAYFNGSTWTQATQHANNAPSNAKKLIDFTWSLQNPLKGALVFPNARNDKTITLKIWTANGSGGGSWSTAIDSAASGGNLGPVHIESRNGSEEFLSCQKDDTNGIYCFKGTTVPAWSSPSNNILTTTSDSGLQKSFDLAYEAKSQNLGIVVYSDNTASAKLKTYNALSNSFDVNPFLTLPSLSGVVKTVILKPLNGSDDSMIVLSDANNHLYSVVWDGTNNALFTTPTGKAFTSHGTNGPSTTDFWYDFTWDRF